MERGGSITWYLNADDSDFEATNERVRNESITTARVVDKNFKKGTGGANKSLQKFRAELAETASVVRNFQVATRGFNMTSIAIAAVAASGAVLEVAAALTALGGLFYTVPAFVGVAVAAFGTVKTATAGMGDAFEAVIDGDMEDLKEAMKKLAPAAQEVVTAFGRINDRFKDIRKQVQQNFFAGLGKEMDQMGEVYLPILQVGLNKNAKAMNGFLKEVAAVSREPFFTGAVQNVLARTAENTSILSGAIRPLSQAVATLVNIGLPYTSMLSDWIVKQSELFAAFTQSKKGQESINIAITNGIAAMQLLGNLIGNIFELLSTVFQVSVVQGLSLISTLSGIVQSMTDWLKTTEGARQFQALISLTNMVIKELADVLGGALGFIFDMVEAFTNLPKPLQDIIVGMLAWIAILTPVITYLSAVRGSLETLKDIVMAVLGVIGGPFVAVIAIVVGLLGGLAFALGGTSENAKAFQDFFASLPEKIAAFMEKLPEVISGITDMMLGIIDQIVKGLPMLISVGTKILLALVNGIITALPKLIEGAIKIVTALLEAFVGALPKLLKAGVKIILAIVNGILNALPKIIEMIPKLMISIINAIVTALPLLLDAGIQIVQGLIKGIIANLPAIIEAVIAVITTLIQFFANNAEKIITAGIDLVNALLDGIIGSIDLIIEAIITIVIAIATALINNIPVLIPAIIKLVIAIAMALLTNAPKILAALVKIIFLLIGGIITRIPLVVGAIGKLIAGLIGKIGGSAGKFIEGAFKLIQSMANGIGQGIGIIGRAIGNIIGKLTAPVIGLAGKMLKFGGDLIRGLWNGISNLAGWIWGKIKGFVDGISEIVKKFFGISSPSKMFADFGKFLMLGFGKGIDNTAKVAVRAAESAADAVMGAFSNIDAQALNASQDFAVTGTMVPSGVIGSNEIQTTRGGSSAEIHQTNIINTELDMNRVNRDLSWEMAKL